MIRALVIAVLAVSATSSCSRGSDSEKVAPGVQAGRVLEVSGSVAATRDGKTRTLGVGAEVFGNDIIDTSADGSVVIELAHNNARWSVEGGQKSRVDESVAWGLAKQDKPAKVVDHATSAAGRDGERVAADTRATTDQLDRSADPASAKAPAEESRRRGGKGGATAQDKASSDDRDGSAPGATTPPARRAVTKTGGAETAPMPPPPPPTPAPDPVGGPPTPRAEGGGEGGGGGGGAPDPKPSNTAPAQSPAVGIGIVDPLLEAHRAELLACLAPSTRVTVAVRVANGKSIVELTGATVTPKVRGCLTAVVTKIKLAHDARSRIELVK
jgi:hypothetical protein